MGKFKFGSKNIQQMVELEDSSDDIFAISSEYIEPTIIEKEIIKEVIVEKMVQVPIEKLVNTHSIEYKTIEVPVEVIKEVIVEKIIEVENTKRIDELENDLEATVISSNKKDEKIIELEELIKTKKQLIYDLKHEHGTDLIKLNAEKSKSKSLTIALAVASVLALLGVIF